MSNKPLLDLLDTLTNTEYTDDEIESISELPPSAFRSYQSYLRNQKEISSFRGLDQFISFDKPDEVEIISPIQQPTSEEWDQVRGWLQNFSWFNE